jgi:hypothetical protein
MLYDSTGAADFEVPAPFAASSLKNSKSIGGTRMKIVAGASLLSKFVSVNAAMSHELRKRGTGGGKLLRAEYERYD